MSDRFDVLLHEDDDDRWAEIARAVEAEHPNARCIPVIAGAEQVLADEDTRSDVEWTIMIARQK